MKSVLLITVLSLSTVICAQEADRWMLDEAGGGIVWKIEGSRLPHSDHIEMSGKQLSVVLRYGVSDGAFTLNRSIVFPMLRFHPNDTRAHLNRRFYVDAMKWITINRMPPGKEKVEQITLDGVMTVESQIGDHLHLTRTLFPSTSLPVYFEQYTLVNTGAHPVDIELPDMNVSSETEAAAGVYGKYLYEQTLSHRGFHRLQPQEKLSFALKIAARRASDTIDMAAYDLVKELSARRALVNELWTKLVLETPDPTLNRAFAFAKLRASESIYATKGGLMHGPGGESYYAALWANDQAEYVNPFFPYLGYETGNESAINSFRHFARFMNDSYESIPSSIIAEGDGIWNGAGDRDDAAMIAYGAARFSLARGDKATAESLWQLIEWCLEYCRRKINAQGVVTSNSDELENRFPSGDANLCTSVLYYDALISSAYLGEAIGKPAKTVNTYREEAAKLRKAIEAHFGATVEGFDTYRYYEGNDILRSWICIPLTAGIFDRAEGTVKALFSPRLWTSDGTLTQAGTTTFWDRSTLYALRGVFAAGATETGLKYLEHYSRKRLLGDHVPYPVEAYPEGSQRHLSAESGLYCRIYTEGILGIRPTGLLTFSMTPHLPDGWEYMNMKQIHAFGHVFDIRITRNKSRYKVWIGNENTLFAERTIKAGETLHISLK